MGTPVKAETYRADPFGSMDGGISPRWSGTVRQYLPILKRQLKISEFLGFVEAMCDVQHGNVGLLADLAKQPMHLQASLVIQCAEWFIQQKRGGSKGDRTAQGDTLFFAATQAARVAVQQVPDPEHLSQLVDACRHKLFGKPTYLQSETELLMHFHRGEQSSVLRDVADIAHGRLPVRHVLTSKLNPAGLDTFQAGDALQKRRLTATGSTHQSGVGSRGNLE